MRRQSFQIRIAPRSGDLMSVPKFRPLRVITLVLLYGLATFAQSVQVYVTSQAGDRITAKPALEFKGQTTGSAGFLVQDDSRDQEMVGFGASFLESGMMCLNKLDRSAQEQV